MQHFKITFRNRSALEQLGICTRALANLSGLTEAQRVNIDLPALQTMVTAAHDRHDRVQSLRTELRAEISRRNASLRAARAGVTRACGMVALNVNLNPLAMTQAGLELESPKRPIGKPGTPTDFHAAPHDNEGAVRLRWKRPVRRCVFEVEARADAEVEWKHIETCVPTKHVHTGLTSGVKYWFRVRAVNAHGGGPWSQVVSVRVK